MDSIDRRIAYLLGKDGRLSNREIGRRLSLSEGTVRQRLSRLLQNGVLRVGAQINTEAMPDAFLALVGLKIEGRRLNECAQAIDRLAPVLTTMIVTGRHDLLVVVLAPSRQTLVDFVTGQLASVEGIKDSETYVVLKNFNQWLPADRLFELLGGMDINP